MESVRFRHGYEINQIATIIVIKCRKLTDNEHYCDPEKLAFHVDPTEDRTLSSVFDVYTQKQPAPVSRKHVIKLEGAQRVHISAKCIFTAVM